MHTFLTCELIGAVELENLPLKKDALKSLDIPLEVKSGTLQFMPCSDAYEREKTLIVNNIWSAKVFMNV